MSPSAIASSEPTASTANAENDARLPELLAPGVVLDPFRLRIRQNSSLDTSVTVSYHAVVKRNPKPLLPHPRSVNIRSVISLCAAWGHAAYRPL